MFLRGFPTGVRFFDEKGGLRFGEIYEFAGGPGTYKTALCHQIAVKFVESTRGKVLYIDTDGTFQPERLLRIARALHINEKLLENIFVSRCSSFRDMFTEATKALKKMKYPFLLIIDSIATPFVSIQKEERVKSIFNLIEILKKISYEGNPIIFTNQIRAQPQSEFILKIREITKMPTNIWEKLGVIPAFSSLLDPYVDTLIFLQRTTRRIIMGRIIYSRSWLEGIFSIKVVGDILL